MSRFSNRAHSPRGEDDTRSVNHAADERLHDPHEQTTIYSFVATSYVSLNGSQQPPQGQEEFQRQEGRPFDMVADKTLTTERQRLLSIISVLPEAALERVAAALDAVAKDCQIAVIPAVDKLEEPDHLNQPAVRHQFQLASAPYAGRRCKNGKLKLPTLPPDLSWPKKRYSEEHRKQGIKIEQFLRDEWLPLIRAGYGELRWLRLVDISAVNAINYLKRRDRTAKDRRPLPDDLHFMTEKEVTDRKVSTGLDAAIKTDPRIAIAVASRVRRGVPVLEP